MRNLDFSGDDIRFVDDDEGFAGENIVRIYGDMGGGGSYMFSLLLGFFIFLLMFFLVGLVIPFIDGDDGLTPKESWGWLRFVALLNGVVLCGSFLMGLVFNSTFYLLVALGVNLIYSFIYSLALMKDGFIWYNTIFVVTDENLIELSRGSAMSYLSVTNSISKDDVDDLDYMDGEIRLSLDGREFKFEDSAKGYIELRDYFFFN